MGILWKRTVSAEKKERVSGNSPEKSSETVRFRKIPNQEIRFNYGILRSVYGKLQVKEVRWLLLWLAQIQVNDMFI